MSDQIDDNSERPHAGRYMQLDEIGDLTAASVDLSLLLTQSWGQFSTPPAMDLPPLSDDELLFLKNTDDAMLEMMAQISDANHAHRSLAKNPSHEVPE